MSRRGLTLIEILISLVIISALLGLGLPRYREWLKRENVRAARRELTAQLAVARAQAVQRGCRAVLHLSPASSQAWVTACRIQGSGTDTVGTVDDLGARFGVAFQASGDSVVFAPQGVAFGASWIGVTLWKGGDTASLQISPVGLAVW